METRSAAVASYQGCDRLAHLPSEAPPLPHPPSATATEPQEGEGGVTWVWSGPSTCAPLLSPLIPEPRFFRGGLGWGMRDWEFLQWNQPERIKVTRSMTAPQGRYHVIHTLSEWDLFFPRMKERGPETKEGNGTIIWVIVIYYSPTWAGSVVLFKVHFPQVN